MTHFKETLTDSADTVIFWKSEKDKESYKCCIRIYWISWEKAVVIATNLTHKTHQKINHFTKEIISFASHYYKLAPNKIMLVEHYSKENFSHKDMYFQVLLTPHQAVRYLMDKQELVALIGKPIAQDNP